MKDLSLFLTVGQFKVDNLHINQYILTGAISVSNLPYSKAVKHSFTLQLDSKHNKCNMLCCLLQTEVYMK